MKVSEVSEVTEMHNDPLRIFPLHTAERHEALKTSIAQHGVERATIWDDQGDLLDTWERAGTCEEAGVFCPTKEPALVKCGFLGGTAGER